MGCGKTPVYVYIYIYIHIYIYIYIYISHVLVCLVHCSGLGPVTDEQSQLVIEAIRMNNTVLDPTYYELNVPLNHEGLWTITLEISVDEGAAMTVFEIEVLETNPVVPILTLMALLGFLFILGVSGRAWIRVYRKKRS